MGTTESGKKDAQDVTINVPKNVTVNILENIADKLTETEAVTGK